MTIFNGVDVSSHRGNIDWAKAKSDGVEFAFLRMGYGSNVLNEQTINITDDYEQDDPSFEPNVNGCESNGIPWGAYLYSYATNLDEAESEYQHIIRCLNGKKPTYSIMLDMEDADGYKAAHNVSNQMWNDIVYYICSKLEAAGYYALYYASKNDKENKLTDSRLNRFDYALAQWSQQDTYTGQHGIWQYTSDGSVLGINGRCDMDKTTGYRDYPEYIKANGLNGWNKSSADNTQPIDNPVQDNTVEDVNVNVTYRVKTVRDGWLSEVVNLNDYAGWQESPIIGIAMKVDVGSIRYKVHTVDGKWHGNITDYDINNFDSGYAGDDKNAIDAVCCYYFTPSGMLVKKAKYRIAPCDGEYYSWQYDTETGNNPDGIKQDGYAGMFGKSIGKFHICIE